jgi:hypothetical protein
MVQGLPAAVKLTKKQCPNIVALYIYSWNNFAIQWQASTFLFADTQNLFHLQLLDTKTNSSNSTNSDIQSINTRHKHYFHMPNANIASYQKGAFYRGIKLFSAFTFNMIV